MVMLEIPRTDKGDTILWSLLWVGLCPFKRLYSSPNPLIPSKGYIVPQYETLYGNKVFTEVIKLK